jgi:glycosyltransferase involved in cell wall biosynthesis
MQQRRLLFLVSEDSYFCSHRLNLGKAALKAGFKVAIATKCSHYAEQIHKAGIEVLPLKNFTRAGVNPWRQLCLIWELYQIYKTYKPTIVHHVAIKPVVIGSCVAIFCATPKIINALGGLGYLFTDDETSTKKAYIKKQTKFARIKKALLCKIVCYFFKLIFAKPNSTLILQNQDDLEILTKANCVSRKQVQIIRGSGINVRDFPIRPFPNTPPIIVACISRMLWDKGIGELVEAAQLLQEKHLPIKILLYGTPDPENPASIPLTQLKDWDQQKIITWNGYCDNVANAYAQCHIAVLPSYREGLPKSLLEAASCGRPIVTTNVPGCREVVIDGENGFLVPAKDSTALANALVLLSQDEALRSRMGEKGRKHVEEYFRDENIHQQILALYNL